MSSTTHVGSHTEEFSNSDASETATFDSKTNAASNTSTTTTTTTMRPGQSQDSSSPHNLAELAAMSAEREEWLQDINFEGALSPVTYFLLFAGLLVRWPLEKSSSMSLSDMPYMARPALFGTWISRLFCCCCGVRGSGNGHHKSVRRQQLHSGGSTTHHTVGSSSMSAVPLEELKAHDDPTRAPVSDMNTPLGGRMSITSGVQHAVKQRQPLSPFLCCYSFLILAMLSIRLYRFFKPDCRRDNDVNTSGIHTLTSQIGAIMPLFMFVITWLGIQMYDLHTCMVSGPRFLFELLILQQHDKDHTRTVTERVQAEQQLRAMTKLYRGRMAIVCKMFVGTALVLNVLVAGAFANTRIVLLFSETQENVNDGLTWTCDRELYDDMGIVVPIVFIVVDFVTSFVPLCVWAFITTTFAMFSIHFPLFERLLINSVSVVSTALGMDTSRTGVGSTSGAASRRNSDGTDGFPQPRSDRAASLPASQGSRRNLLGGASCEVLGRNDMYTASIHGQGTQTPVSPGVARARSLTFAERQREQFQERNDSFRDELELEAVSRMRMITHAGRLLVARVQSRLDSSEEELSREAAKLTPATSRLSLISSSAHDLLDTKSSSARFVGANDNVASIREDDADLGDSDVDSDVKTDHRDGEDDEYRVQEAYHRTFERADKGSNYRVAGSGEYTLENVESDDELDLYVEEDAQDEVNVYMKTGTVKPLQNLPDVSSDPVLQHRSISLRLDVLPSCLSFFRFIGRLEHYAAQVFMITLVTSALLFVGQIVSSFWLICTTSEKTSTTMNQLLSGAAWIMGSAIVLALLSNIAVYRRDFKSTYWFVRAAVQSGAEAQLQHALSSVSDDDNRARLENLLEFRQYLVMKQFYLRQRERDSRRRRKGILRTFFRLYGASFWWLGKLILVACFVLAIRSVFSYPSCVPVVYDVGDGGTIDTDACSDTQRAILVVSLVLSNVLLALVPLAFLFTLYSVDQLYLIWMATRVKSVIIIVVQSIGVTLSLYFDDNVALYASTVAALMINSALFSRAAQQVVHAGNAGSALYMANPRHAVRAGAESQPQIRSVRTTTSRYTRHVELAHLHRKYASPTQFIIMFMSSLLVLAVGAVAMSVFIVPLFNTSSNKGVQLLIVTAVVPFMRILSIALLAEVGVRWRHGYVFWLAAQLLFSMYSRMMLNNFGDIRTQIVAVVMIGITEITARTTAHIRRYVSWWFVSCGDDTLATNRAEYFRTSTFYTHLIALTMITQQLSIIFGTLITPMIFVYYDLPIPSTDSLILFPLFQFSFEIVTDCISVYIEESIVLRQVLEIWERNMQQYIRAMTILVPCLAWYFSLDAISIVTARTQE
jgi:hypothetical protein